MKRLSAIAFLSIAFLSPIACGQTRETRSVADLQRFEACRIEVEDGGTKPAWRDLLVDQVEVGLTGQGICDVTPGGDLVLRLRPSTRRTGVPAANGAQHVEARVEVALVDGATNKNLGAFSTKTDSMEERAQGLAGKNEERVMRRSAEEIVAFLRSKRGGGRRITAKTSTWSPSETASAPGSSAIATTTVASGPQAPAPLAQAPAAPPRNCTLQCVIPNRGPLQQADDTRLTNELGGTMNELRACLGAEGGGAVYTLRFSSSSKLASIGIDVGDHDRDESPCMTSLRSRLPEASMPGPLTVRCTERCSR